MKAFSKIFVLAMFSMVSVSAFADGGTTGQNASAVPCTGAAQNNGAKATVDAAAQSQQDATKKDAAKSAQ